MVNKGFEKVIVLVFLFFLFIELGSATINFSSVNHSIVKEYGLNSKITGWINFSLNKEPSDTLITGKIESREGKITLLDLIKKNPGFIYSCDVPDCTNNYISISESSSFISFELESEKSKVIGINITGENINSISSFSMNVNTNGNDSDKVPVTLDVLNDNEIEWQAYIPSEEYNSEDYGCYNSSKSIKQADLLNDFEYCEVISLQKSPSVNIGAKIIGSSEEDFTMSISDGEGNYKSCNTNGTSGKINCVPENFQILKEGDYFVCIKAKKDGHKINFNDKTSSSCGFSGDFSENYDGDFEIFAQTKKYAPVINAVINESESEKSMNEEQNIATEIEDYINERYSKNCSKGCIIPLKITSGISQNINISDLKLSYKRGMVGFSENLNLFLLNETSAKITSSFQKLNLDEADFYPPKKYGNYTFSLFIKENKIFSERIKVERGIEVLYITPSKTAVNYSTEFKVFVVGKGNISKYTWDFGNNTIKDTTSNSISHEYKKVGNYKIKVTAITTAGKTSFNTFDVTVLPISEAIKEIYNQTDEKIKNLKLQIKSNEFSSFEKRVINNSMNITNLEKELADIQVKIAAANTNEKIQSAFNKLIELEIPEKIKKEESGQNLLFYPEEDSINLNILKNITGGSYDSSQDQAYKEAIIMWEVENIETNITFSDIKAYYESGESYPFVKTFEFTVNKKTNDTSYLIMRKMEDLIFEQDYQRQTIGNYYYFLLNTPIKKITFSTTDPELTFENLPIFISPKITELSLVEDIVIIDDENNKKFILTNPKAFWTITIIVILIGMIAWVLIKIWYIRRYEHHLFLNRGNLINLTNYLKIAKMRDMDERSIIKKLKKVGWTSEQIKYVLNKYLKKFNKKNKNK